MDPNMDLTNFSEAYNGSSNEMMDTLAAATGGYRRFHGYVSGFVCLVGIIGNIINATIWSRKHMLTSTNHILTALAVADCVSLFMYFLYATYFFVATGPSELSEHSKAGMYLVVISFHEFLAFHTLANWLTISLAIFRYMKVCQNDIAKKYCNVKRARLAILVTFIVTALATIPFYLYYEVYNLQEDNSGFKGYWLRRTTFARRHISYQQTLLWLYGVIFKIVPSGLMLVLSILMIKELRKATKRHEGITKASFKTTNSPGYNRTTIMLLAIVFIYMATEVPIAITSFVAGLEGGESHFFYFLLYSYIGDLIDLIALLNGTLNFFVYYGLSKQFRETFTKVFFGKLCKKYSTTDDGNETVVSSDNTEQELSSLPRYKKKSIRASKKNVKQ